MCVIHHTSVIDITSLLRQIVITSFHMCLQALAPPSQDEKGVGGDEPRERASTSLGMTRYLITALPSEACPAEGRVEGPIKTMTK